MSEKDDVLILAIIIDEIMFVKNKRAQRCIVLHICRNLIYKLVFRYHDAQRAS